MQVKKRLFTVEDYHNMAAAKILTDDERTELIEGEIIRMTPIGSRHAGCLTSLIWFLTNGLGNRAMMSVQSPLHLNNHNEPQPDLMLLQPRNDFYHRSLPTPQEVLLLIEVSDTTPDYDRRIKLPLYAQAEIPEVWIVNLIDERIEVYRTPVEQGYQVQLQFQRGEQIALQAFPDIAVPVDDVLG